MVSTHHQLTDSIIFFQRTFPSANMTLILGDKPLLIDTGFGSDFVETRQLLESVGVPPENLHLVINTHYHCDHVGGNHQLQSQYGLPIATYYTEAKLVNARDAFACSAEWLNQPIEPYTVDQPLRAGDEITSGAVNLQVLHTPGHTLGHISLYESQTQILILGDVVHPDDVAWLNNFREGVGALERMVETLEYLLRLPVKRAISGHGAPHENPTEIMQQAIKRYEKWRKNPEKIAWHAMKRIFIYGIMLTDGLTQAKIRDYLINSPWFIDYTQTYFQAQPEDFVPRFMEEILRSGAAQWVGDKLYPTADFQPLPVAWYPARHMPRHWE